MAKSDKDTIRFLPVMQLIIKAFLQDVINSGSRGKTMMVSETRKVSFEIRIHPPWFRSVIAYIIYVIAFIFLLAGYIRFRTYRLRRDKTRLKAEIEEATAELEIKNRKLAEIDRIKTHFYAYISHEIRTPLALILDDQNFQKKKCSAAGCR